MMLSCSRRPTTGHVVHKKPVAAPARDARDIAKLVQFANRGTQGRDARQGIVFGQTQVEGGAVIDQQRIGESEPVPHQKCEVGAPC